MGGKDNDGSLVITKILKFPLYLQPEQNQNQNGQPQQSPGPDAATLIAQLSQELGQLDSTFVYDQNV